MGQPGGSRGVFAYIVDTRPEELQSAIDITLRRFAEYQRCRVHWISEMRKTIERKSALVLNSGSLLELHDGVVQSLSVADLALELDRKDESREAGLLSALESTRAIVSRSLEELRATRSAASRPDHRLRSWVEPMSNGRRAPDEPAAGGVLICDDDEAIRRCSASSSAGATAFEVVGEAATVRKRSSRRHGFSQRDPARPRDAEQQRPRGAARPAGAYQTPASSSSPASPARAIAAQAIALGAASYLEKGSQPTRDRCEHRNALASAAGLPAGLPQPA